MYIVIKLSREFKAGYVPITFSTNLLVITIVYMKFKHIQIMCFSKHVKQSVLGPNTETNRPTSVASVRPNFPELVLSEEVFNNNGSDWTIMATNVIINT